MTGSYLGTAYIVNVLCF